MNEQPSVLSRLKRSLLEGSDHAAPWRLDNTTSRWLHQRNVIETAASRGGVNVQDLKADLERQRASKVT